MSVFPKKKKTCFTETQPFCRPLSPRSWSCMQSEARGEGDLRTDIEPVSISIGDNNHYIHYGLSEST